MPTPYRPGSGYRRFFAAMNARPRQTVFVFFAVVFAVTLILAVRQYFLGFERQVDQREHRLQLHAIAVDMTIDNGKNQLRLLRNVAERLLLDAQADADLDPDLQQALQARENPVWGLSVSPVDAPVRAIGDKQLAAIPGLFRDPRTFPQDLILSRALSQMFPAQYEAKRYIEHVLYVSTSGLVVAYPRIPDEKLVPVLKAYASSQLMHPRADSANGDDVAFKSIEARQVFLGARLLLTTPVLTDGVPRGAIVFEVLQQKLQDYLYAGTPPDELHVLLDPHGLLIASNQETFNEQEGNWLNTLSEPVSGLSMPAMLQSGKGVLRGGDSVFFYRVLHDSELLLLNKVPINELRWSVIEQFSSIFIFVWLSLAALLVVTLFVVDHLLLNQLQLNARLTELGLVDTLTQLANRRRLQGDFKGLVRRLQGKQPIALLMIDIDRFKFINDNWGHSTGDEVLKHLATLCRALVRPHDLVARYGGEEFCVMLPATTLHDASRIAEKLRSGIEQSVCLPDPVMMLATAPSREVHLTVSIGVAELGADQVIGLEALVAKADRRLYAAKQNGRNQVVSDDSLSSE